MVGVGTSAKKTQRQGTAVTKKNQTIVPEATALAVPDQVKRVMDQIAADLREGRPALALGAGRQIMAKLVAADVTGPRSRSTCAQGDAVACGCVERSGCSRLVAGQPLAAVAHSWRSEMPALAGRACGDSPFVPCPMGRLTTVTEE